MDGWAVRVRLIGAVAAITAVVVGAPAAARAAQPLVGRAHVMRRVSASTATVTAQSIAHLNYYGGPVMGRVKVVEVVWGSGTYRPEVTSDTAPSFSTFFGGITNSAYFDWLSEYSASSIGIQRGTFAGRYVITPAAKNSGATIDDVANIQPELRAQINAHNLPTPDVNTLYFLFFPAGKTITLDGADNFNYFCAYHGTETFNSATNIRYAVLPDSAQQSPGCGPQLGFNNMTSVASHELVESVTDPDVALAQSFAPPLAWYDPNNGESADICNGQQSTVQGGDAVTYTVQKIWSNQQNACITTGTPRTISVGNASIVEGDAGTHTLKVPVTLSAPSNSQVTVKYALHHISATPGTQSGPGIDYQGGSGTVTFPVGASGVTPVAKWISVRIYGDVIPELTEYFNVQLSHASPGYAIAHSTARAGIINDDKPRFAMSAGVGDMTTYAGDAGDRTIAFPITLSRAVSTTVSLHWTLTPVSAVAGVDYAMSAPSGTVTLAANTLTATINVNIFADPTLASARTFKLTISPLTMPANAGISRATGSGTIAPG